MAMQTLEEVNKFLELENQKLKKDNAIMRRDMRIIGKELLRIFRLTGPDDAAKMEILSLIHLIRLLKQR